MLDCTLGAFSTSFFNLRGVSQAMQPRRETLSADDDGWLQRKNTPVRRGMVSRRSLGRHVGVLGADIERRFVGGSHRGQCSRSFGLVVGAQLHQPLQLLLLRFEFARRGFAFLLAQARQLSDELVASLQLGRQLCLRLRLRHCFVASVAIRRRRRRVCTLLLLFHPRTIGTLRGKRTQTRPELEKRSLQLFDFRQLRRE